MIDSSVFFIFASRLNGVLGGNPPGWERRRNEVCRGRDTYLPVCFWPCFKINNCS